LHSFLAKKNRLVTSLYNSNSLKDSLLNYGADTLRNGNQRLILTATLWRDFFPTAPADGRPLVSYAILENLDSTKIPDNLKLTKQYVINGSQIWISSCSPSSEVPHFSFPLPYYVMAGVSFDGPKWGPNIFVTVIAEIIDSSSAKRYWIRAINQQIQMTI
jgi:hypothetical protein